MLIPGARVFLSDRLSGTHNFPDNNALAASSGLLLTDPATGRKHARISRMVRINRGTQYNFTYQLAAR